MKRKRQKKYLTEADVLKDIDKAHHKIHRLEKAIQCHLDLEELEEEDLMEARKHSDEADRLLGQVSRLRSTRLVRLGATLADMRTIPMGEFSKTEGFMESQVVLCDKVG